MGKDMRLFRPRSHQRARRHLCGFDNGPCRHVHDQAGFDFCGRRGLGRRYRDFRAVDLRTLPTLRIPLSRNLQLKRWLPPVEAFAYGGLALVMIPLQQT
jgi:hypothetical protein